MIKRLHLVSITKLSEKLWCHVSVTFLNWFCDIQFQHRCNGWGILSLKLVSYKNPASKLFNGECCDTPSWCGLGPCENYLKFCVTSLGSLQPCDLRSSKTKVLGDDDFRFPGVGASLGTNLLNPLTYNFSYWQVGMRSSHLISSDINLTYNNNKKEIQFT